MTREIPGYPGYYARDDGEIITTRTDEPQVLYKHNHNNYYHVKVQYGIGRKTRVKKTVHQLMLLAFKGDKPFESAVTRHLDGDPLNNNISNLKYGTAKENAADSIKHGTMPIGEEHPRSKLKRKDIREIVDLLKTGMAQTEIAKLYGVSQRHISDIKLKRTWRHITSGVSY